MTITLTREEAQQVLDALENLASMAGAAWTTDNPIETLRARLAQPEPEAVVPLSEYKKLQELVTSQGIRLMEYESQPEPEELTDKEKIVYDILCSDETPPNGQHWEGFVAQKIVKALAQPEPEPVAWFIEGTFMDGTPSFIQVCETDPEFYTPLYRAPQPEPELVADKYLMEVECTKCGAKEDGVLTVTAPPQREWQGLTDEEIMEMLDYGQYGNVPQYARNFVDAIEAKLKEKNA